MTAGITPLCIADYEEVLADKRRLTRELDVAMHGEAGAAKQASLCDLIHSARSLRLDAERYRFLRSLKNHVVAVHRGADAIPVMIYKAEALDSGVDQLMQQDSAPCEHGK